MGKELAVEVVATRILTIRGKRVMLDKDLARLYGVSTRVFNQSVKRHIKRFPPDFMFQVNRLEFSSLMSQIVTSKRGGTRKLPLVFTEQGVAMLSGILNSDRAVQANIAIMRAFVKLRELLVTHKEIAEKVSALERKTVEHDTQFLSVFEAIKQLMAPPRVRKKPKIGFHP